MTMHALVSLVQIKVPNVPRETIVNRAREAWPSVIDFKETQVNLLANALIKEQTPGRTMNRALHLGGVSRPQRVM